MSYEDLDGIVHHEVPLTSTARWPLCEYDNITTRRRPSDELRQVDATITCLLCMCALMARRFP